MDDNRCRCGGLACSARPDVPVLEPERKDGRARGVTREHAALHPDGPADMED